MAFQGFCAMAICQVKPAEPVARLVAAVQHPIGATAAGLADRGPVKQHQIAGFRRERALAIDQNLRNNRFQPVRRASQALEQGNIRQMGRVGARGQRRRTAQRQAARTIPKRQAQQSLAVAYPTTALERTF